MEQPEHGPVRDGNGNVRQEIVRSILIYLQNKSPHFLQRFGAEWFGHELADRDEVLVQVAHPSHRELLRPTVIFAQPGDECPELINVTHDKGGALSVQLHGVLVPVDVVAVHTKPFAVERWEPHQPE